MYLLLQFDRHLHFPLFASSKFIALSFSARLSDDDGFSSRNESIDKTYMASLPIFALSSLSSPTHSPGLDGIDGAQNDVLRPLSNPRMNR
jgi:hypothetical protein